MGKKGFAKAMAKATARSVKASASRKATQTKAEARAEARSGRAQATATAFNQGRDDGTQRGKSSVSFRVGGEKVTVETEGDSNITLGDVTLKRKK